MGGLFSRNKGDKRKPDPRITDADHAVLQVKKQRDQLKLYQRRIEAEHEKLRRLAKECLKEGKRDKAMLLLKKKKRQDVLLERTMGQLDNLEQMVDRIEEAQTQNKVMEGLKSGNQALKQLHALMSREDVERIMEDTQDSIEYQKELDELLGGGMSQEDDDDLLAELDQIVAKEMPELPDVALPEIPDAKLPEVAKGDEQEKEPVAMLAS